jgi:hypothetical protein
VGAQGLRARELERERLHRGRRGVALPYAVPRFLKAGLATQTGMQGQAM